MKNIDVILCEDLVFAQRDFSTAKEVITFLSRKLLEEDYVKESFLPAVIEREKKFPTGLPTEVPVALPHTDAKHCNHSALAIATLKKPVLFGEMGNPNKKLEVRIVFLLALSDQSKQTEWIKLLLKLFQGPKFCKELLSFESNIELYRFVKSSLEQIS
jgi:PTS system galactitol-specific IIA component